MTPNARLLRRVAAVGLAASLSGCAGSLPDLTQARGPCTSEQGGWCPFTRDMAVQAWRYAQLSSNAYCDHTPTFELPAGYAIVSRLPDQKTCELERAAAKGDKAAKAALKPLRKASSEPTHGFAYTVYDKRSPAGRLERRVIAFRGTDFGQIADWFHGTIRSTQRKQGLALYAQERQKLDAQGAKNVPIDVTGHSLGGAIALQVSLANEGADAYVFNTSPRYKLMAPNANLRIGIAERGDVLAGLRSRSMPARQDLLIINCAPKANNVKDHSARRLAGCLTWIAAQSDPAARASVAANAIPQPPGETANLEWGLPTPDPQA